MKRTTLPSIGVSIGDPAGIGPEVTVKALTDRDVAGLARWVVVGDAWLLERLGEGVGWTPDCAVEDLADAPANAESVVIDARQLTSSQQVTGKVDAASGRAALEYGRRAVDLCLAGEADAIVTAPLNKEAVALNGIPFTGHTEFIAERCGAPEPRMLLLNDRLCVVHVTTHCSLGEAAKATTQRVLATIEIGHGAMQSLGFEKPRIAVCGLNPHAGESGMFGEEESNVIEPAIAAARAKGMQCTGPFPADTVFLHALRGDHDLLVAMYHDQGHIPMKLLDFEHTVNVSLGLPIIRTSVDHGTAFDIAGTGQANPEDMKAAMRCAVRMAGGKQSAARDPA